MDERFLNVTRDGVLAVPAAFWFAMLALARHTLFVFFTVMASKQAGGVMTLMAGGVPWPALAGELPALALMWSAGSRRVDAGEGARWLWRRGAVLVWLTVFTHLLWSGWMLSHLDEGSERTALVLLCFSLLDLSIAWVFSRSHYYQQLFQEFPSALPNSAAK